MKLKKLIVLILAIILVVSLAACSGGGGKPPASSGNNPPSSGGTGGGTGGAPIDKFEFGVDFIENNLKDNYHIVYEITTYEDNESDTAVMEQIWTKEGVYFAAGGDGMLFIKNGEEYVMYYETGAGSFEKSPMNYPKEMVEAMISGLSMYMSAYASFGSELARDGSETIAGRDCERYTMDYKYPYLDYKLKYTYCIDKATGVCLKFKMDVQGEGKKVGYEFLCTMFKTSGVTLPKYK